jgi:exopolysaccharide biosynthesis polyprenyl glycosylphosphotransferase
MNMAASDYSIPNAFTDALTASCKRRKVISKDLAQSAIALCEVLANFLTVATAIDAAYVLQLHIGNPVQYPTQKIVAVSIMLGLFAVFLRQGDSAYLESDSLVQIRETERTIRTSTLVLLLLFLLNFLLKLDFPRMAILIAAVLVPFLLTIQKQILAWIIRRLHARGYGINRVIVYGAGKTERRIVSSLLYSLRFGLRPVAFVDDDPVPVEDYMVKVGYRRGHSIPVERGPVTPALLKSFHCDLLIVTISALSSKKLAEVARIANEAELPIAVLPELMEQERQWTESIDIAGLLSAPQIEPVPAWHSAIAKRTVDFVGSSLLLVLFAPILFLIVILIRLDSPGPALFVQKRVGRNGKLFDIFKFRSMHADVPKYDRSPVKSTDPRITRIGRFLRRNSLDELPQLLNVFLGNMSLVGPRPEMPFIVQRYSCQHRVRLQMVPGITGLWQLSADRAFPIHENIHHDLYYARNRTFCLDLAILLHTLFFATRGGV